MIERQRDDRPFVSIDPKKFMSWGSSTRSIFALAVCLLVPVFLIVLAVPRLVEGIGLERARIAYEAAIDERPLPASVYQDAADAMSDVMADDGDALIERAELTELASNGRPAELHKARDLVIDGLLRSPVNPRGWTLLCQIDIYVSPTDASRCMDTAFFIAPFDWFLAPRRAVLAAYLWPQLDADVRAAAARRVRLMWEADEWPDHRLKRSLYDVYRAPNGPALLTAGFEGDKDEMRALNRWLLRRQMYGPQE